MFSLLRNRFGIPGVISVIALVFAMTGGAFAAKYVITSPKQIKPSVLKALQGKQGPAGTAGSQGPAGAKGDPGQVGPQGKEGPEGKEGKAGKNGSPWTAGGTLPSEETETGVWAANGTTADAAGVWSPISFTIPLSAPLGASEVHFSLDVNFSTTCTGTVASPTAPPGHLCVYGAPANMTAGFLGALLNPATTAPGAAVSGAALSLSVGTNPGFGSGTWAVTAP